jgi:hypothetical protein
LEAHDPALTARLMEAHVLEGKKRALAVLAGAEAAATEDEPA